MKSTYARCLLSIVLLIHGCSMQTGRTTSGVPQSPSLVPDGRLDFGWKLSGDRAVAPLQVFSDNSHTWLHWHPNQTVPAIFASDAGQEQVLSYKRQDPYTVIEGQWSKLSFRAGRQQAQARRLHAQNEALSPAPVQAPATRASLTSALATSVAAPTKTFTVTAEDQYLRQALVRWAGISGWHFKPEHWGVEVDIPLSAGASFTDDFVTSVQALLLSTELSDRPLQPCFYSNQVLRIVPYAETCDRTTIPGAPV